MGVRGRFVASASSAAIWDIAPSAVRGYEMMPRKRGLLAADMGFSQGRLKAELCFDIRVLANEETLRRSAFRRTRRHRMRE